MRGLLSMPQSSIDPEPYADRVTVLVAEDEILIRMDVAEALREAGFRVLETSSADEAIQLLEQGHAVDVIFSDINMPGKIDGLDLYEIASARFPLISVILTSAVKLPDPRSKPAPRFLPKPYSIANVLRAIGEELGKADV